MALTLTNDSAPSSSLTGWRAHQKNIDALPYHDPLPDDVRAVESLIEEEVRDHRLSGHLVL